MNLVNYWWIKKLDEKCSGGMECWSWVNQKNLLFIKKLKASCKANYKTSIETSCQSNEGAIISRQKAIEIVTKILSFMYLSLFSETHTLDLSQFSQPFFRIEKSCSPLSFQDVSKPLDLSILNRVHLYFLGMTQSEAR